MNGTLSTGLSVRATNLCKRYEKSGKVLEILNGAELSLEAGERVAVMGPSGSGKSTLLHLLGLLDRPDAGELHLGPHRVSDEPPHSRKLATIRNRSIGFVFQAHHLLPEHTAVGNVMVPCRLAGASVAVARQRAERLLTAVGLGDRLEHRPGELSGGEQQRVAIARGMVMGPGLVLADEPTGNLDPATAAEVFDVFLRLNEQLGSTLVVVTHTLALGRRFPRILTVRDGRLVETEP